MLTISPIGHYITIIHLFNNSTRYKDYFFIMKYDIIVMVIKMENKEPVGKDTFKETRKRYKKLLVKINALFMILSVILMVLIIIFVSMYAKNEQFGTGLAVLILIPLYFVEIVTWMIIFFYIEKTKIQVKQKK